MNYYVVSPNAWNDGNFNEYLNYMRQHHVVFMGWGTDSKYGNMFANLAIGDRIIVARGANKQKVSYFAGIVDSKPIEDRESPYGFTQYCELRSYVELEADELPFSTKCAYGASNLVVSIYMLKKENPADAKIIRRLEKLFSLHEYSYSLREIANWGVNKHVAIPALQRGLVWSPRQVELLWDSIFRGFPVGSFLVTSSTKGDSQATQSATEDTGYFLLDGQQRYNAISLAFQEVNEVAKAVLWYDLLPPNITNSSRRFWFKVTTLSHPWGYGNDDNCSLLGWQEYRKALAKFTGKEEKNVDRIRLKDIPLACTWPTKSNCPIRMSDVIKIYHTLPISSNRKEKFIERIEDLLNNTKIYEKSWIRTEENKSRIKENASVLYDILTNLEHYRITANVLRNETVASEDNRSEGTANIEVLFTRLNTLGTAISPYDLRYSAIKAYWGTIKETNDEIASQIMPAANLAMMAFRLAMTLEKLEGGEGSVNKLASVPTVSQIRKFGENRDDAVSKKVLQLYDKNGAELKNIVNSLEEVLCVYKANGTNDQHNPLGLPPVLRTNIIDESPELYLMLAVLVYKKIDVDKMLGLILWVHWFSKKGKVEICNCILDLILKQQKTRQKEIMDFLEENRMVETRYKREEFEKLLPNKYEDLRQNWSFSDFQQNLTIYPWMECFNRLGWNRQLMIFAEREYFNKTFDYDPAMTNFNSGHNRPWDVDHIVPQNWMSVKGKVFGKWKGFCCQWLGSIGNLAAIPFSTNRSKQDKDAWDEYEQNANELHFDGNAIGQLNVENLTCYPDKAFLFGKCCLNRILKMYEDLIKLFES